MKPQIDVVHDEAAIRERVLALGHRLDAELAAEPAHRQGLDALTVGQLQGALDHLLPRERALAASRPAYP